MKTTYHYMPKELESIDNMKKFLDQTICPQTAQDIWLSRNLIAYEMNSKSKNWDLTFSFANECIADGDELEQEYDVCCFLIKRKKETK